MWVGTRSGLNLWHSDKEQFTQFYFSLPKDLNSAKDYISVIYQDKNSGIWVGTRNGLFLLEPETGKYQHFGYEAGFISESILSITQDQSGNLWLLTPLGMSRFDPLSYKVENFDERDGLSGSRYFVFTSVQTSDGTIYFTSRDGIHYFNPKDVENLQPSAKTLLTNFEILGAKNSDHLTPANMSEVNLKHDENYIKFEFSTLDFVNARLIKYKYKLEGFDTNWIDNGTSNTAVYTNLTGGDYRFRVRAAIKEELHYEDELAIDVHIATPYWQQWWMMVFYAGLLMLAFNYYIQRKGRKNQLEIERQKQFVITADR
jgi:ligand-binding sensor domain-containing protein